MCVIIVEVKGDVITHRRTLNRTNVGRVLENECWDCKVYADLHSQRPGTAFSVMKIKLLGGDEVGQIVAVMRAVQSWNDYSVRCR